jgi:hypothetical protein
VRSPLGSLGGISGGKLYILGVAGYNTPIWDVLALQGEREEAGERLYGAKFVELSRLGKRCQVGLLGLSFACWARWARFFIEKKCTVVDTTYLHTIYCFINLWARKNGWMA